MSVLRPPTAVTRVMQVAADNPDTRLTAIVRHPTGGPYWVAAAGPEPRLAIMSTHRTYLRAWFRLLLWRATGL